MTDFNVIYNLVSLSGALVIFGYKAGQIENKIEKLITSTQLNFNDKINNLNDYIDQLKNELTILKKEIHKDDEISLLKMSRSEYELRSEIKLVHLQIKTIIETLKESNIKVHIVNKDTLK
jgi:hypothetical protein